MTIWIDTLSKFGAVSSAVFWLPVLAWTLVAILALGSLHLARECLSPLATYHVRRALLWALPLGLMLATMIDGPLRLLPASPPTTIAEALNHSVVTPPISAPVSPPANAPTSPPASAPLTWPGMPFWIGLLTLAALLYAGWRGIVLLREVWLLRRFSATLPYVSPTVVADHAPGAFEQAPAVPVRYGLTNHTSLPMTFGWWRPVVVLPAWLLDREADLRMVLLHEWTHIRRRDYLWQWIERLLDAFFALHPLVRLLVRQIQVDRERVCDAEVLAASGNRSFDYAALLYRIMHLAEKPATQPVLSMAERPSTLRQRIMTMRRYSYSPSHLRRTHRISFSLSCAFLFATTSFIACSELSPDLDDTLILYEDVPLTISEGLVYLNDERLSERWFSTTTKAGNTFYLYVPERGLFLLKLTPFSGAERAGRIEGNLLTFTLHETSVRITSSRSILDGRSAPVYVRHDPDYDEQGLEHTSKVHLISFLFGHVNTPEDLYNGQHDLFRTREEIDAEQAARRAWAEQEYEMQLDRPVVRLNGERIYHGLTGYGNLSGYLALYHSTYGRFVFSGVPFDGATQVAEVSGATIRVATSALNLALIAKTTVLRDGDRTLWFRHDPNYIPSPPSNRAQDATRQALQYEGVDPDLAHDRAGILTGSDISELNRTPAMGTPVSEPVQVNITGDAFYVDGQRVAENELRNTIRTVMGNRRSIMLRASIDASVQQFATVATIAQELHLRVLIATEDGGFRPTSLRNVLGSFQPTSLQTLLGRIGD